MWLLVSLLAGCSTTPAPDAAPVAAPASAVRKVDSAALQAALDAKQVPVLIDVRTAEEYAAGHVPGAKNLPIQQLGQRASELDPYKSGEVWLICEVGGRSAAAARQLSAQGFQAVDVTDGTAGWRARNLPVEQ